jgi:regulator of sigma E protease
MLIILLVIIGLSLLILGHEAGHFFVAKAFGLKIDEFGFGFPPRIFAIKRGETEYSFNWLPFGGFVKISGERGEFAMQDQLAGKTEAMTMDHAEKEKASRDPRLLFNQPAWKKSLIMLAGVFVNFIIGWLLITIVLLVGTPNALVISRAQAGSPAEQAGIMSGDVVKGFANSEDFIAFVNAHRGQPISLTLIRNNKEVPIEVTPRVATPPGEGAIGVELQEGGSAREAPLNALWDGLRTSIILVWLTLGAFGQLIAGLFTKASLLPGVVGPVGIFSIAQETGKIGMMYLVQLLGIVSLNLAVVNLIPFPALDGGRFLVVLIEKIKGSAVSTKIEMLINGIGFAFLLLLMVLLTVRDIHSLL